MSKLCTINVDDEVNCRIGGLRPEDHDFLWNKFGIFAEGFTAPPCTFNIVTDEMNILEMMVKSKLSNDLKHSDFELNR